MNKEIWVGLIAICVIIAVLSYLNLDNITTTKISLFSGFAGLLAILFTQYSISQRSIQEAHRKKKTEIYIEFLNLMAKAIQSTKKERENDEEETKKSMMKFKTNIILWGSPDVITCYLEYEQSSSNNNNNKNVLLTVDKLYIAMRKDIGLSNRGLTQHDLIKMYLQDHSELDDI